LELGPQNKTQADAFRQIKEKPMLQTHASNHQETNQLPKSGAAPLAKFPGLNSCLAT
jgi:hypothetical protein